MALAEAVIFIADECVDEKQCSCKNEYPADERCRRIAVGARPIMSSPMPKSGARKVVKPVAAAAVTLGTILKYREDQERVRAHGVPELVDAAVARSA